MNPNPFRKFTPSSIRFLTTLAIISCGEHAFAANLYWDTSSASGITPGSGTWDAGTTSMWATSSNPGTTAPGLWTDGNGAIFNAGTGTNTVTISGVVAPSALSNTGITTISSGTLSSLSGGITTSGTLTINSAMKLTPTSGYNYFQGTGVLNLNGPISELSQTTLRLANTGSGLTTFTLGGTNTFTGGIQIRNTVAGGTTNLILNSVAAAGAGGFGFGRQSDSYSSTLILTANLATSGTFTQNLIMTGSEGNQEIVNSSGAGTATFTGAMQFAAALGSSGQFGQKGNLDFRLGGLNTGSNTFQTVILDSGGVTTLTKQDAGTWVLTGANTYTGATTITGGGLVVSQLANGGSNSNLGASSNIATNLVFNGGTLKYTGTAQNTDRLFSVGTSGGTIDASGSGALNLTNTGTMGFNSQTGARTLILTGTNTGANTLATVIGDNGGATSLYKQGTGKWVLTGSNSYSGATTIAGGELAINGRSTNSAVTVSNGATLSGTGIIDGTVTNSGILAGSLILNGDVSIASGATAAASAFNGNITDNGTITSAVAVQSGKILSGSGTVSGNVTVNSATVNGNSLNLGTTTLNGSSTLSGYNIASKVTVASGSTSLTGTTKSTSALVVSAGATLNANGTIDGSATVSGLLKGNSTVTGNLALTSGTLAPGNSPGITKIGGDFITDPSSKLVAEVSGTVAGTSYDQVQVSGNVSLAGTLDLTTLSGLTLGTTITLIDNTGSGTTTGYFATILTSGSTYTITSNSDYTFSVNGEEYLLSYKSNTEGDAYHNDVTLTAVPEPCTWGMLAGGLGLLAFGQRMRRRLV